MRKTAAPPVPARATPLGTVVSAPGASALPGAALPVPGNDQISGRAILLAVLVCLIWGVNFVVIKIGVTGLPPLFLAALRFILSAFPALLFVQRPACGMGKVALYGILLGVGEFGFLFTALKLGAPAGISSIVLQSQAFFTALLAALFFRESIRWNHLLGMAVAAVGLVLIVLGQGSPAAGSIAVPGQAAASSGLPGAITPVNPALPVSGLTLPAVGLTLPLAGLLILAALGWAAANVTVRTMPGVNALQLMVWSSLFSPLPLLGLSAVLEGPATWAAGFAALSLPTVLALAYLVLLSTLFGYGAWNHLISKHGAGRIAPFSLLVPLAGVSSAAIFLGEAITPTDIAAAVLVMGGLALHIFGGRLVRKPGPKAP